MAETAKYLRGNFPERSRNRISTIARTELGQAADEGRKQSMKDLGTVTHVSVIGCEAREAASPTYRGESTCNIEDVPIGDMDTLEFHINHTGTIVPSRFAGEEVEEDAFNPFAGIITASTQMEEEATDALRDILEGLL